MDALIAKARFQFHKRLFETNTLTLTSAGVASNAKALNEHIEGLGITAVKDLTGFVDKIYRRSQWANGYSFRFRFITAFVYTL